MRESFIFYRSFYESIKELDPLDQVQIYNAIFNYEFYKKEIELKGICKSIFTLILPQLKANDKRYENGKKGGRPKNQKITKTKPKQNLNITKTKPNNNLMNNVNVNDNVILKEKINKKEKYFENLEVNNLFLEFLELRKKIKCKNTSRAINLLFNKLIEYDDNTKIEMLNNSIMNSWKSVYPLKENEIKHEPIPNWFDKEVKNKNATAEEQKQMKILLKEFE